MQPEPQGTVPAGPTRASTFIARTACRVLFVWLLAGSGCSSLGPGTVQRDRLHYATALADSVKEQILLNIVKLRYWDAPTFLEVMSVVSGYSLETGVTVGGQFSPQTLRGDTFVGAGVAGKYTDHPTISYSPMTGEKFARSLMTPVPIDFLILYGFHGGMPVDFLLGLTVSSIEGHYNLGMHVGQFQPAEPQFTRLLQLLRALQEAHAIESESIQQADHVEVWMRFRSPEPSGTVLAEQRTELKTLLGIPAEVDRVRFTFGTQVPEPGVIGMRTRSLLQILVTLGAGVQFLEGHPANAGVVPVDASQMPRGFTVHSGKEKPDDAISAVPYEDLWFWIDRRDLDSKITLTVITMLFNFLEGGTKTGPPLTIPAS